MYLWLSPVPKFAVFPYTVYQHMKIQIVRSENV
jgi:hypothetical protein